MVIECWSCGAWWKIKELVKWKPYIPGFTSWDGEEVEGYDHGIRLQCPACGMTLLADDEWERDAAGEPLERDY